MYKFGKTSLARLSTAHAVLQALFKRVIKRTDCSITQGTRGEEAQTLVFERGLSRVQWPNSKHNSTPSMAVDVVPWPEKWSSIPAFLCLMEIVLDEWAKMEQEDLTQGFTLIWGGDWQSKWDGTGDRPAQSFDDLPHWELGE